ncbi:MAG TPA: hypothetical protein PK657_12125 [Legionella sp.]|nr:hypothetical protein [Legionella sp.]
MRSYVIGSSNAVKKSDEKANYNFLFKCLAALATAALIAAAALTIISLKSAPLVTAGLMTTSVAAGVLGGIAAMTLILSALVLFSLILICSGCNNSELNRNETHYRFHNHGNQAPYSHDSEYPPRVIIHNPL